MYKGVFWPPVLQKEKLYPEYRLTWGESRLPLALRARSNTATEAKQGGFVPHQSQCHQFHFTVNVW